MASRLLEYLKKDPLAYAEYLNQLSFDELIEVDLHSNACRNLEHVAGKYYVPILSGSYDDVYQYAVRNMVHPDDQAAYAAIMDPAVMAERLEEANGTVSMELQGTRTQIEQVLITIENSRYISISQTDRRSIPVDPKEKRFRIRY